MLPDPLPPLLVEIDNGDIKWQMLENLDHEMLGFFLSCHLVIEHYLDELLKIDYPRLDWDASRQTFNQKTLLLSKFKISENYDFVPAIKHMNNLRNKLSHDVEFKINSDALLPLSYCLKKAIGEKYEPPTDPKEILKRFTALVCASLTGWITCKAEYGRVTRK